MGRKGENLGSGGVEERVVIGERVEAALLPSFTTNKGFNHVGKGPETLLVPFSLPVPLVSGFSR